MPQAPSEQTNNRPAAARSNSTPPISMPAPRSTLGGTGGRKRADLHLQGLPPFHPAVYKAPNSSSSSSSTTSSPFRPHRPDTRPPSRLRPEPQLQVRRAHSEFVTAMQRPSTAWQDTPKAPSLAPVISPGPPTPLNLHDSPNDYLSAGSAGGLSAEKVEEIIRKARESGSGLGSGRSSPAVSPAGGRG